MSSYSDGSSTKYVIPRAAHFKQASLAETQEASLHLGCVRHSDCEESTKSVEGRRLGLGVRKAARTLGCNRGGGVLRVPTRGEHTLRAMLGMRADAQQRTESIMMKRMMSKSRRTAEIGPLAARWGHLEHSAPVASNHNTM